MVWQGKLEFHKYNNNTIVAVVCDRVLLQDQSNQFIQFAFRRLIDWLVAINLFFDHMVCNCLYWLKVMMLIANQITQSLALIKVSLHATHFEWNA